MGLTDRLRSWFDPVPQRAAGWGGMQEYLRLTGGGTYPLGGLQQTLIGPNERVALGFEGLAQTAYQGNGVVFACLNARLALFTQARFMFRQLRSGTPGELFSSPELDILRVPWPNGTTADLLARMIQDADLGGNSFIARRVGKLARLRPDWVTIVHGSFNDPDMGAWDPDAEVLGYVYSPGGIGHGEDIILSAAEVAHFAPTPDPLWPAAGMSWITPLAREVEADTAMTTHKRMYVQNGATPNLVVTGVPGATIDAFNEWKKAFGSKHDGLANAYRTLYFSGTADAKVVGNDLAQVDFKAVQGAGETRIAAAASVPPIVVGLSEGLQGSSLNAGNFQAAMRRFADLTGRTLWQNACGSLASILTVPPASELWTDDRYVAALKDDIRDFAEVQAKQAQAIRSYVDAGFEPDAVIDAVNTGDLKRLAGKHSGLYSVQLQPPAPETPPEPAPTPSEDAMSRAASALTDTASALRAQMAHPVAPPEMPDIIFGRGMFEGAVPVTFHPGDVNVTTPPVTIERGAVEVSAPVTVTMPEPVALEPVTPDGVTRIVYDAEGRIAEIVEGATP